MSEYVSIGLPARDMMRSGVSAVVPGDSFARSYCDQDPDAIALWKNSKPELAALSAVLIDRMFDRVETCRGKRPPFGLIKPVLGNPFESEVVEKFNVLDPVALLRTSLKHTIDIAMGEEFAYLSSEEASEVPQAKAIFERYCHILSFRETSIWPHNVNRDRFMQTGIETAADVFSDVVGFIPQLMQVKYPERNVDASEMSEVFANSFTLITRLSKKHFYEFVSVYQFLRDNRSRIGDFFEITSIAGKDTLVMKNDEVKSSELLMNKVRYSRPHGNVVTGCPAKARLSDEKESVTKRLHVWITEISKEVYSALETVDRQ